MLEALNGQDVGQINTYMVASVDQGVTFMISRGDVLTGM